jgi:hypothetical protein
MGNAKLRIFIWSIAETLEISHKAETVLRWSPEKEKKSVKRALTYETEKRLRLFALGVQFRQTTLITRIQVQFSSCLFSPTSFNSFLVGRATTSALLSQF